MVNRSPSELERVIAAVRDAEAKGRRVDREALIARHPHLAAGLRQFFAEQNSARSAEPATLAPADRNTMAPAHVESATLPLAAPSQAPPGAGAARDRKRAFGDYELLQEIARGGMGVVYRARQGKLNRIVALKMILAGQLASQEDVARFYAEAEAAAQLDHPGIVPIYEVGVLDGQHFFSMGFIEGESLAAKIAQGPLPSSQAAELTRAIAQSIAYAHLRGVVHRDLKPANVLVDKSGQPKVTDFGLAKRVDGDSGLTRTGVVLGTPSYMPPEQASGDASKVGPLADVYSLGAILYCLLTGRPPFVAATPLDTLMQVLGDEPVPPRRLNPSVPPDIDTICLKCLQKEAKNRYPSAQELADELCRFLRNEPIRARPLGMLERCWRWCKRNPTIAAATSFTAAAALAALVVLSVSVVLVTKSRNNAVSLAKANSTLAGEKSQLAEKETKARLAEQTERVRAQAAEEKEKAERKRAEELAAANAKIAAEKGALAESEHALREQSERAAAALLFEHAHERAGGDDLPGGLLSLVRALERAENQQDEKLAASIRWQIGAWRRELFGVHALLPYDRRVEDAIFSPDGDHLLAVYTNGPMVLWDVRQGVAAGPPMQAGAVFKAWFAKEGKSIVAVTQSGQLTQWDAKTCAAADAPIELPGRPLAAVPGKSIVLILDEASKSARLWSLAAKKVIGDPLSQPLQVEIVRASESGELLLTGANDHVATSARGRAQLWRAENGKPHGPARDNGHYVTFGVFSPDDKWLITGGDNCQTHYSDHSLQLWEVAKVSPLGPLIPGGRAAGRPLTDEVAKFSPNSRWFAVAAANNAAQVFRVSTQRPHGPALVHLDAVRHIDFSPDSRRVLTSSDDRTTRVWDIASGRQLGQALRHERYASGHFSPKGDLLATASHDIKEPLIRVWNSAVTAEIGGAIAHERQVRALAIRPDGRAVVTVSDDGFWSALRSFELPSGKELGTATRWKAPISAVAWHPSDVVIVADVEGLSYVDPKSWQITSKSDPIPLDRNYGVQMIFSPFDANVLFVAYGASGLLQWDFAAKTMRPTPIDRRLPGVAPIRSIAIAKQGAVAITGSATNRTAQFWDAVAWRPVGEPMKHDHDIVAVAFSSDGQLAATASRDRFLRFWQSPSGALVGAPIEQQGEVLAVVFHPSLPILATGGQDRTVRFWDVDSQRQIGPALKHAGEVNALAFTPDGNMLVAGCGDQTVLSPGALVRWRTPAPALESVAALRTQIERMTSCTLDERGAARPLTIEQWRERAGQTPASPQ
jgi:serine/threonine protein kinase/WD40 repeat protein